MFKKQDELTKLRLELLSLEKEDKQRKAKIAEVEQKIQLLVKKTYSAYSK